MGADSAGKSTLLNILAGGHLVESKQHIAGEIYYDDKVIDSKVEPWQRCAYVEALDEHFRDLSVEDIVTYAMKLRCIDIQSLESVENNVALTLELLRLSEYVLYCIMSLLCYSYLFVVDCMLLLLRICKA